MVANQQRRNIAGYGHPLLRVRDVLCSGVVLSLRLRELYCWLEKVIENNTIIS